MSKRHQLSGALLPAAMIVAVVGVLIVLALSRIVSFSSKQNQYLTEMDRTYRLAETGFNDALGKLAYDPNPDNFDANPVPMPEEDGVYESHVYLRTQPVNPVYYIITSATRTVAGRSYYVKLHSYARVTNTSEYFIAVTVGLTLSHPVDVSEGKIYAPDLLFIADGDPSTLTRVKEAQYLNTARYRVGGGVKNWTDDPAEAKIDIKLGDSGDDDPVQLGVGLLFPQLSDADIVRYEVLAGPHIATGTFKGVIYPPGYSDFAGCQPGDHYCDPSLPGHTTDNRQHVYFYDGDMSVEGTVHGQVLFVATGDIHITSNVFVSTDPNFPGESSPDGSEANQAVFITTGNVIIEPNMDVQPPAVKTQTLQALFIAPHGSLIPRTYSDPLFYDYLSLDFTGSLIVSSMQTDPSLPEIFRNGRTYRYMESLRTHPPPYLPVVTEIYFMIEETRGAANISS